MKQPATHYERAFSAFLQDRRVPYVGLDQARKAVLAGARLKSFDFIVYPPRFQNLLADVKGRKFSYAALRRGRLGQSWVTAADVEGLTQWERAFGADYVGMFIFAYWLCGARPDELPADIFRYEQRDYIFTAVQVSSYRLQMRPRSASWNTVSVLSRAFRQIAQPVDRILAGP